MKLKKLKLINFKSFDAEYEFVFEDRNLISGKNGAGKSAIKDAILFCLYNRTPDGSLSDSTRHITNGKIKCLVELTFEKNGQEHTVRRERTEKQTRLTYRDNSQSEEDSVITQETLESMIPSFQNFSAVFNIGWFMGLNDREKRDYILKLTPEINRRELFVKLGGATEDIEKFNLAFDNLERTHKGLLETKRENDLLLGAMRMFNTGSLPIEIPKAENQDQSAKISEAKKAKENLVHLEYAWKEYERIKKHNSEVEFKNRDIEKRIAEISVSEIEMPTQDKINQLIAKKNEYSKQVSLPQGTCPVCLQAVAARHRIKIEKANLENKKHLVETESLLLTEQRSYGDVLKTWQANEENKKKILMFQTQFLDPLPELTEPAERLDIPDPLPLSELEADQRKFFEEQKAIEVLSQQEEMRKQRVETNHKKVAVISQENDKLTFLIKTFSPRGLPAEEMNLKLEPLKKTFQELLPGSDIVTLELLKNEMGYKEIFSVVVDGKDYAKLSLGEKTRVDISLSQIINKMLPEKVDVFFLDNSEVLDNFVPLPIQSFICKVTNQPLKIN